MWRRRSAVLSAVDASAYMGFVLVVSVACLSPIDLFIHRALTSWLPTAEGCPESAWQVSKLCYEKTLGVCGRVHTTSLCFLLIYQKNPLLLLLVASTCACHAHCKVFDSPSFHLLRTSPPPSHFGRLHRVLFLNRTSTPLPCRTGAHVIRT